MRKFGSLGLKILKMSHILLIVLFLGGILSSFALIMKLDLSNFDDVYMAYKTFNILSDNVVKMGAQGTILLGAIYGFFTKWGFIKHKWLAVKWILFIMQTLPLTKPYCSLCSGTMSPNPNRIDKINSTTISYGFWGRWGR